jgi:acetyl-CoA carboxylase carboxyltransferase component
LARPTAPGDGVVGGGGTVAGRPVFAYAQDQSFAGGSLGEAHAATILRVMELAERAQAPVIGFIASGGARMDDGVAALAGYGRIFRHNVRLSGRVPQISVICGVSAGGGSYSPALTDFVVMTEESAMFLTGPGVVRDVMGEDVDAASLGGPRVHSANGVSQFVAADDRAAVELVRDLLSYLPQRAGDALPIAPPADGFAVDPSSGVPASARQVYDVRGVIAGLVDGGDMLEVSDRWARNMVTALARIDGRPVGVIANQPWFLGGVIDATAAQKAARFVRTCNAFGLPLVVLVDTPGFLPGTKQEGLGVIRHGAKLLHAFAEAVVPKVTVVLRKAYGGAYICMNSKDLGADLALAWPGAEIGIMGPKQAVGVVHRRALADADDPEAERDRLAAEYAEDHLSAAVAAQQGFIDEIVEPRDTRRRLAGAIAGLSHAGMFGNGPGNIPL